MRVLAWLFILVATIGSAAAQPAKGPRIGIVATNPSEAENRNTVGAKAIQSSLEQFGWVDGKNVELIWRSAEGRLERWPAIIDELLATPVDVLVILNTQAVKIALQKTRTVPVVCPSADLDFLMREKLIGSLARPGGNLTGMTIDVSDGRFVGKNLGLLKAVAPRVSRVAFLLGSFDASSPGLESIWVDSAKSIGVTIFPVVVRSKDELDSAFTSAVKQGANGVFVGPTPIVSYFGNVPKLAELAIRHRLPVVYQLIGAADSGGLMSYSVDLSENFRRTGYFVDKILRGTKPGDIAIEQPSRMELVINLKAARAIGLTVPPSILLLADRVID